MNKPEFEAQVFALLEEIEIAAACAACGRLSLLVLTGESCPQCTESLDDGVDSCDD